MLNYQILFCNDSVRYIRYVQETLKNDIVIISLKLHTTIRKKISVVMLKFTRVNHKTWSSTKLDFSTFCQTVVVLGLHIMN